MSDEQKQGPYRLGGQCPGYDSEDCRWENHQSIEGPEGFRACSFLYGDADIFIDRLNLQAARIAELKTAISKSLPPRDHSCSDECLFLPCVQRRRIEKLEKLVGMLRESIPMVYDKQTTTQHAKHFSETLALYAKLFPEGGAK